jgi:hypothetical protein
MYLPSEWRTHFWPLFGDHRQSAVSLTLSPLQGYLTHTKDPPPRTQQQDYLGSYGGPTGGGCFL